MISLCKKVVKKIISKNPRIVKKLKQLLENPIEKLPPLKEEFKHLPSSAYAMQKLLEDYDFTSVLDIGSGEGLHTEVFLKHGKKATSIDYGHSPYFNKKADTHNVIIGDFNTTEFNEVFDCIWASHILEHQLNVQGFLLKIKSILKENGALAITVPPLKSEIVGGHLSLWNAGLVLYRLVMAGFDCREASILRYGYNISVIVRKKSIEIPNVAFDNGDIEKLSRYLPPFCRENFDGNIQNFNW